RKTEAMWMWMISNSETADQVFHELICVLEDWPLHHTSTSDGASISICPLAASRALQEILKMPGQPSSLDLYFPYLFLTLLFQSFSSMEELPEEVNAFWKKCQ
ncbi:hypothetical protein N325_11571, partial [Colius striatus]